MRAMWQDVFLRQNKINVEATLRGFTREVGTVCQQKGLYEFEVYSKTHNMLTALLIGLFSKRLGPGASRSLFNEAPNDATCFY